MEAQSDANGTCNRRERQGFGDVKNAIASFLTLDNALKLATSYQFQPSEIDAIQRSERPTTKFVDYIAEKGHILDTSRGLSSFRKTLQDNDLGGIADKIQRFIHSKEELKHLLDEANDQKIDTGRDLSLQGNDQPNPPVERILDVSDTLNTERRDSSLEGAPETTETETRGQTQLVRKMKLKNPGESDQRKRFICIHNVREGYPNLCTHDKATLIGIASEIIDNSLETPTEIFMIRREGGITLKDKSIYLLENYTYLSRKEGGLLIGPHTKLSAVSRAKFRGVELNKYEDNIKSFRSSQKGEVSKIDIPTFQLTDVKYQLPPKHPVLLIKGVIKKISERDYKDGSTPRRVITLIDSQYDFLSVVVHEKDLPISKHEFKVDSIVKLQYFETARTKGSTTNSNFVTSTRKSVITEIKDEKLDKLRSFDFVKGQGKRIEGCITQAEEVSEYPACPVEACYLKEVNADEEGYYCPKCGNICQEPKNAYFIKLCIESDDGQEYNGVIFTFKINQLKDQLQFTDFSTDHYLESLPEELLDRKVKAKYACNHYEGLNNIFNDFELF